LCLSWLKSPGGQGVELLTVSPGIGLRRGPYDTGLNEQAKKGAHWAPLFAYAVSATGS